MKHKIELRVAFISPVDGAAHTSSLQLSAFPNGKPLRPGDVLPLLAPKSKVDKTRMI